MHRETASVENVIAWAQLNGVTINGVKVSALPENRGSGLVANWHSENGALLISMPSELILCEENVWTYARSDRHLLQILEAVGDFARTARGAILIFLLLQLTNGATRGEIGTLNPFSEYVKYIPVQAQCPTFWNHTERSLLTGTSLEHTLEPKLKILDEDFTLLREKTISIAWCQKYWWNAETGKLTFDDWKEIDAMYRSRALEMSGIGDCMIPCMDMANHASGDRTSALYAIDGRGNAILALEIGKRVMPGEEITITYGDKKGASEMLFSYGFIESTMASANELCLIMDEMPDDDPLIFEKMKVLDSAPGVHVYLDGDSTEWESFYIWLLCVNKEDGLEFKVLQDVEGGNELQATWKEIPILDIEEFRKLLEQEPLWDLFHLRAIVLLQNRIEKQLLRLQGSQESVNEIMLTKSIDKNICDNVRRLRDLEETLMLHAYADFEAKKLQLSGSPVVLDYLRSQQTLDNKATEDDFS